MPTGSATNTFNKKKKESNSPPSQPIPEPPVSPGFVRAQEPAREEHGRRKERNNIAGTTREELPAIEGGSPTDLLTTPRSAPWFIGRDVLLFGMERSRWGHFWWHKQRHMEREQRKRWKSSSCREAEYCSVLNLTHGVMLVAIRSLSVKK